MADRFALLTDNVRAQPFAATSWLALLEALYDAGQMGDVAAIAAQAKEALGNNPDIEAYAGMAALAVGDAESAVIAFDSVLGAKQGDARSLHNRASALRMADRAAEALGDVDTAISSGKANVETLVLRAHILAELGQLVEATGQYRDAIARQPDHIDAHDTLARLLPQIGHANSSYDAIEEALATSPQSLPLWHCALRLAHDFRDGPKLAEFTGRARAQIGDRPEFIAFAASAAGFAGDAAKACAILQPLLATMPQDATLHSALAHWALCAGDVESAERHALDATRIDPVSQTAWSLLTIIWRLKSDPREEWLADYDRLVMPLEVDLPSNLKEDLEALHFLQNHPAEHSVRGGTQTRGYIFNKRTPSIQQLGQAILSAAQPLLAQLPQDQTHPFLSRKQSGIGFSGAWSVRLASSGFHINHFHPQGWLSSALYVDLPDEIDTEHGALAFGVPDAAFGLDLAPRRIEVPAPGKLVLFPSYFWHGTLPFESTTPRLTVAFDALPQ